MNFKSLSGGVLAVLSVATSEGRASADVVEVRLVHAYEIASGSRVVDECRECESVRIDDWRAEAVSVSKTPDLRIANGATRAILAYEVDLGKAPEGPSRIAFRVILVVDGATRIALAKLRAEPAFEYAVVSVDGKHRSLGDLRSWSPWELDAGFFQSRDEISSVFSGEWPAVHVVQLTDPASAHPDAQRSGSVPCGQAAPCPPDERGSMAEGPAVWAQGAIRNGVRHGVWTFFDYTGDVVRLEILRDDRLLETIEPWEHPDTRQLKKLMKQP